MVKGVGEGDESSSKGEFIFIGERMSLFLLLWKLIARTAFGWIGLQWDWWQCGFTKNASVWNSGVSMMKTTVKSKLLLDAK